MAYDGLERYLTMEPRNERIIVLEELDFIWGKSELKRLKDLWDQGVELEVIAEEFERDSDEVFLALLHLGRDKRYKHKRKPVVCKRMAIG